MSDRPVRDRIYEEYAEKVTHYIRHHVGDKAAWEDLCQEVFLKIYTRMDTFDETRASLSTWIYTITRNTVIDYYRSRRLPAPLPEELSQEEPPADTELDALADAIASLDERSRDIIIAHYYGGRTLKTIAECMGISYVYVKVLHRNALQRLEEYLKG